MLRAHTVDQVRAAEAELLAVLPAGALMARAAHGLATAVTDFLGRTYGARVLLVVGSGDNGGDALYAGATLRRRGAGVEAIVLDAARVHEPGLRALVRAGGRVVAAEDAERPDVVVDAVVGIGARGPLRPAAAEVFARFADRPVVAVDVPSGVGVDDGRVDGEHVRADLTVAFGTHKAAHLLDPAASVCGTVALVDLALSLPAAPFEALRTADVAALIPRPGEQAHKYSRGVVGLRTGSAAYPGAAVLSVSGAGCGLAGMVRYAGAAADEVLADHPEVTVGAGRVQAWVVGSGGGARAGEALRESLADDVPVVVDADALQHLEGPVPQAILTPHAGELAALLGLARAEVEAAPLEHARAAADRFAAVVLLKGRRSLVVDPAGPVRVNTSGVPWLATAGAGDVLAGLVGALAAAGLSPYDAASAGAWLHGTAATLVSRGGPLTASALARALPAAIRATLAADDPPTPRAGSRDC